MPENLHKELVTRKQYLHLPLMAPPCANFSQQPITSVHLFQLYLCQSPYFASMFSGSWRESNMNNISITIVDPNITLV